MKWQLYKLTIVKYSVSVGLHTLIAYLTSTGAISKGNVSFLNDSLNGNEL